MGTKKTKNSHEKHDTYPHSSIVIIKSCHTQHAPVVPTIALPTVTIPVVVEAGLPPVEWVKGRVDSTMWVWGSFFLPIFQQIGRLQSPISAVVNWTNGKKTYFISIAALSALIFHFCRGELDLNTFFHQGSELLLAITFRHAIQKNED